MFRRALTAVEWSSGASVDAEPGLHPAEARSGGPHDHRYLVIPDAGAAVLTGLVASSAQHFGTSAGRKVPETQQPLVERTRPRPALDPSGLTECLWGLRNRRLVLPGTRRTFLGGGSVRACEQIASMQTPLANWR